MPAVAFAVAALATGVLAMVVQRWSLAIPAALLAAGAAARGGVPTAALRDGADALAFVAGMVFIAAAAEQSGLLARLADALEARVRSERGLLAATFLVAVVLTTACNLDTTAVLFTPLALAIAARRETPWRPYALASILAANFGSALLPTSNLTNLVVWRRSGISFAAFAGSMLPAALVGTALALAALVVPRWPVGVAVGPPPPRHPHDPMLERASAVAIVGLVGAFFLGAPVGPLSLGTGLLLVAFRRRLVAARLEPRLALAVAAVFAAAGVLAGEVDIARHLAGVGRVPFAGLAALAASVGTNLAATLVLEPAATTRTLRTALLVGVDLGVGFTPIASLATVLWRDALRARRLPVPWALYLAVAVPLSLTFLALVPLVT